MRISLFQVVLGIAISAALGAGFAIASNLISGSNLIGFSVVSTLVIGAVFGSIGALLISIAAALSKKSTKLFLISSGIIYGAAIYLLNVYFSFNAGFSLFGLVLISAFGSMSGIGTYIADHISSHFRALQQLS